MPVARDRGSCVVEAALQKLRARLGFEQLPIETKQRIERGGCKLIRLRGIGRQRRPRLHGAHGVELRRPPGRISTHLRTAWLIEQLGQVKVGFELGSTEAIKQLAAAGTGIACLSRQAVAADIASGRLVELQTTLPTAKRRLAIVMRRGKLLGQATQNFMAHCHMP